jgi:hypothetical protein
MTLKSILLTVLSYWNKKKNLSKTTSNPLADAWFNGRFKSKRLQESRLHNNEDKTMLVTTEVPSRIDVCAYRRNLTFDHYTIHIYRQAFVGMHATTWKI